MKKLVKGKLLHYLAISLIVGGAVWFVADYHYHKYYVYEIKTEIDSLLPTKSPVVEKLEETIKSTEDDNFENIIALISALSGILIVFIKFGLNRYEKFKNKKVIEDPNRKSELFDNAFHPIFSDIDQIIDNEIAKLKIGSEGRSLIFQVMLREYLYSIKFCLNRFLRENKEFESSWDYRTKVRLLMSEMKDHAELRWKNVQIPEIVINRYLAWSKDREDLLLSDIDTIIFHHGLGSYDETTFYILTALDFVIKLGITNDAINTLGSLNGELNGLIFQGKKL